MSKELATRLHDFSYGHIVTGHEGKCRNLHGHNGRIHFTVTADELDSVGRVMDFAAIKDRLCSWLEENWDHKFLVWEHAEEQLVRGLQRLDPAGVVVVPFNPTAENMARYLLKVIGPQQLAGTGCVLIQVRVEETRKCSAEAYEIT